MAAAPQLPAPRGPLSELLIERLAETPAPLGRVPVPDADPTTDEDLALTLYVAYELHYRGFDGVDERWEWEPSLLALRGAIERSFEAALREAVPRPDPVPAADAIDIALRAVADADDAPSLSRYVQRSAPIDEIREFVVHRSAYQLKEADPHSWAIARLDGPPKAALVEVQADEYGGGRPERIHARMFADAMAALELDPGYGAYLDRIPAITLATVNAMSLFGLHRRLRGAIVGHLALFEMTSAVPNRRYGDGLRRLGYGGPATAFFDEHVVADAVHESVAAVDLAGGLARQEPEIAADILWGAGALVELEGRFARHLLGAWSVGVSSLLRGSLARSAR